MSVKEIKEEEVDDFLQEYLFKTTRGDDTVCKEETCSAMEIKVEEESYLTGSSHGGLMSTSKASKLSQLVTPKREIKEEEDSYQEYSHRAHEKNESKTASCKEEKISFMDNKEENENSAIETGMIPASGSGDDRHTGGRPHQSATRGKAPAHGCNLRRHMKIHTVEMHPCMKCGKTFMQKHHLQSHLRTIHTGQKPVYHPCITCGKSFTTVGSLATHQRLHTGEKPYQCTTCGRSFIAESNLRIHQRIHSEKHYHCTTCGQSFKKEYTFQSHQRTHTGQKPYQCSECGRSFIALGSLKRHQRLHTGEKPYHCTTCGRSFTDESNLRRHQMSHARQKPYR